MADQVIDLQLKTIAELKGINETLAGLKKIGDESKKAQDNFNKTLSGIGKQFGAVASSISTVTAGLVSLGAAASFLKGSFAEALEAEKSLNVLRVTLEATGEATESNIKSIQDYAAALQETTRFADDVVIQQVAIAKNFGLSTVEAKRLVTAATELAAVQGTDLASANDQLLKALSGQLPRDLKTLGKEFSNLTDQQLRAGSATDLILSKFTGRAAAELGTTAGAVAQLGNSFKQLQESVGLFLVKVLDLPAALNGVNLFIKNLTAGKTQLEKVNDDLTSVSNKITALQKIRVDASVIAPLIEQRQKLTEELIKIQKVTAETKKEAEKKIVIPPAEFRVDEKSRDEFLKSIHAVGLSAIQIAKQDSEQRKEQLNNIFGSENDLGKLSVENQRLYADAKFRIEKELANKLKDIKEKQKKDDQKDLKERLQILKDIRNDPSQGIIELLKQGGNLKDTAVQNAVIQGLVQDVGKTGNAKSLITPAATLVGGAFGGPAGGEAGKQIGGVLNNLTSKDAAREFVTTFLDSIPELVEGLIQGILEAFPVFLEKIPEIVDKLIKSVPRIITALIEQLPKYFAEFMSFLPAVAFQFAESLIENVPRIVEALVKAIGNAPGKVVKGVGKLFGFAEGGGFVQRVPAGFGNGSSERFPALLGSGELVIDSTTSRRLQNMISRNEEDSGSGRSYGNGSLSREDILALANRPIVVKVNEREIARTVRNQVRGGFVLA